MLSKSLKLPLLAALQPRRLCLPQHQQLSCRKQQSKTYYVHFVRSPYARAKILKIDYEKALNLEGVVRVFTGPDFEKINLGYWMHLPTMMEPARHPLAVRETTYNGEPVAAVLAVDPYTAEDAAELVDVDYEVLEPVLDPIKALFFLSTSNCI